MGVETILIVSLLAVTGASGIYHDEQELSQLPKLYHLDDYERCLEKPGGVYCVGQFQLYTDVENHPTYGLIEKYSKDLDLYNRSYLHHGYCLNTRCPGAEDNVTARFENCVDKWVKDSHGLRARLHSLSYCKEHGKPLPKSPNTQDTPHRVFLYVVLVLLALNIIGTIYDLKVEGKDATFLRIWSIRRNWRILTEPLAPDQEAGLDSLHGLKASILTLGPLYFHALILITAVHQYNPRNLEKFHMTPIGPMGGALTMVTQMHLVISNFLTVNMLLKIEKVTFKLLPELIVKRICRMLPVYLLVIGFAATWWTSLGAGPMWHHLVENESSICRNKFWLTTTFLQNWVDPAKICLVQTWIMCVDMQVHIPVLVVTVFLKNHREWTYWVLSALYVLALAVVMHVAYTNDYLPAYTYMKPEMFREVFANCRTFVHFYMTPTGCLMSVVAGVSAAFIHQDLKISGYELKGKLWRFLGNLSVPVMLISGFHAYVVQGNISDSAVAALIPIERIFFSIWMTITVLALINVDCVASSFMQWSFFRPISKMSLAIAMVHWVVNGTLVANRYTLHDFHSLGLLSDLIVVVVLACLLATPLTIMVDTPMQKTVDKIVKKVLR